MRRQLVGILDFISPNISHQLRRAKDYHRLSVKPVQTPLGFQFRGNPLMEQGTFEPGETQVLLRLLQDATTFVNVGANIGYYCCLALSKGVRTIAFEPIEVNAQLLLSNVDANRFDTPFELFPLALGQVPGALKMYGSDTGASIIPGWAGTPENYCRLVPVNTLDTILAHRLPPKSVILMDIEGGEFGALQGAEKLIESRQHTWIVEICASEHQPSGIKINPRLVDTFEIFWKRGYDAYTADPACELVKPELIHSTLSSGRDLLRTHNFVFLPRDNSPTWKQQ